MAESSADPTPAPIAEPAAGPESDQLTGAGAAPGAAGTGPGAGSGPVAAGPEGRGPWYRRRVAARTVQHLSLISMVMVLLIVLTGAAVRLTGSGLGCSDWPTCSVGHLAPALHFHPLVEFSNRMVTVVLTIVVGLTLVAALLRRPFRRDLAWLAGGLVAGVLAQAVIGGILVYTKLNPYVLMVHFVATMLLVVDAVVLVHRGRRDYTPGSGRLLVPRPVVVGTRAMLALVAVVIVAGSATSGAGPHAGDSNGQQVARRLPVSLRSMAELHSSLALLLVGVTIGLVIALHAVDVPEKVRRAGRILVAVLFAQAAIGYTQYFTHLPALLVELHVAGATAIVVGSVQLLLSYTHHRPEAPFGTQVVASRDRRQAPAEPALSGSARVDAEPAEGTAGVAVGATEKAGHAAGGW